LLLVIIRALGAGQEAFLKDTGIATLVEGDDAELLVSVFLDDAERVVVGVKGGHED